MHFDNVTFTWLLVIALNVHVCMSFQCFLGFDVVTIVAVILFSFALCESGLVLWMLFGMVITVTVCLFFLASILPVVDVCVFSTYMFSFFQYLVFKDCHGSCCYNCYIYLVFLQLIFFFSL